MFDVSLFDNEEFLASVPSEFFEQSYFVLCEVFMHNADKKRHAYSVELDHVDLIGRHAESLRAIAQIAYDRLSMLSCYYICKFNLVADPVYFMMRAMQAQRGLHADRTSRFLLRGYGPADVAALVPEELRAPIYAALAESKGHDGLKTAILHACFEKNFE